MSEGKKIISVVGARPNFIKLAPMCGFFRSRNEVCHTGQHRDYQMSEFFFRDLQIQNPDFHIGVTGGTHAGQTAEIMRAVERVLLNEKPDLVLVYGDVNLTMASSIVAAKLKIRFAHIEAGLRSFDRTIPEEINRVITDSGGIQEETTYLGTPCVTFRKNTECPVTVEDGTNQLAGDCISDLKRITYERLSNAGKIPYGIPEFWDGRTAERIGAFLIEHLEGKDN